MSSNSTFEGYNGSGLEMQQSRDYYKALLKDPLLSLFYLDQHSRGSKVTSVDDGFIGTRDELSETFRGSTDFFRLLGMLKQARIATTDRS
jgi:hypothetical protein